MQTSQPVTVRTISGAGGRSLRRNQTLGLIEDGRSWFLDPKLRLYQIGAAGWRNCPTEPRPVILLLRVPNEFLQIYYGITRNISAPVILYGITVM